MENAIRLIPVFLRELSNLIRESVQWTLVGVACFLAMWFLIEGLPRVVAAINTLTSSHVVSSGPAHNDAPGQLATVK